MKALFPDTGMANMHSTRSLFSIFGNPEQNIKQQQNSSKAAVQK
jgi:hypothetical protein